jgi:ribosomal protein S18 acetylase RimI-like enzyme
MKEPVSLQLLPFTETHREWASAILKETWGSTKIVSKGRLHDAIDLPGYVAIYEIEPVGLVTYHLDESECEMVTLNSSQPALGIGTALVTAVKEAAVKAGSERLWVITTNDNVAALRFYQQRGFRLAALHKDALRESRRIKPQIPRTGKYGIPIRDELELEIWLAGKQ